MRKVLFYRNETNGYVRRGMPLRAPGEAEQLIKAAEEKRARKAARYAAGVAKAEETRKRKEEALRRI